MLLVLSGGCIASLIARVGLDKEASSGLVGDRIWFLMALPLCITVQLAAFIYICRVYAVAAYVDTVVATAVNLTVEMALIDSKAILFLQTQPHRQAFMALFISASDLALHVSQPNRLIEE